MSSPTPTTGSNRTTRQLVSDFIGPQRPRLVQLALVSFAAGLLEAAFLALLSKAALGITRGEQRFTMISSLRLSLGTTILVGLGLVAVRLGFAVVGSRLTASLNAQVVARTRDRLADAFLDASWSTQQAERGGQLHELLTNFVQQGSSLLTSLTNGTSAAFNLLSLIAFAVFINPVGAAAIFVFAIALGSVLRPIRAAVRRRGRTFANVGMQFATALSEISELGLEVHVFNVQQPMKHRIRQLIQSNATATERLVFAQTLTPLIYTCLSYAALVGALAVVGSFGTANLDVMGAVVLVMLRSLSYGQGLQNSITNVQANAPFVELLDAGLERYQAGRVPQDGVDARHVATVELVDVTFGYDADHPVLHGINLTIPAGEVLGLVGASGGGKTTLVQLLLGLRTPTSGQVLADGRPIHEYRRDDWARRVTFVPQASHLITGTIADNIRFLRDDVTDDDIRQAARLANLHADIERLPGGYECVVGSGERSLSGGQLQRLSIARALVEQPDVLIMDEPTSALDVDGEAVIRDTIKSLKGTMTIVIIAHRLSTLEAADRVIEIANGRIVETTP